ncbi:MAG: hypothetical protein IT170_19485 [Bryobacterales bacterium]|nr:hypothetical protein [Bryobacterales bacterium]
MKSSILDRENGLLIANTVDHAIVFQIRHVFPAEKTDIIRKMDSEPNILDALRRGDVRLPPFLFELAGIEPAAASPRRLLRPDAYVDGRWSERTIRFAAELRAQATPKVFRDAIEQLREYAAAREMRPLLVTTYLAPDRLAELEAKGVSGVDLCGNGVVVIPGEVLVFRTGNPNKYPAGRIIRNVYQGASSLVARVFLLRPSFGSVQEVRDEVAKCGGSVSLGTVSKVLKVLEDDLVIRRDGRATELIQPDELLDRLAKAFRPPSVTARKKYQWTGDRSPWSRVFGQNARRLRESGERLVKTGASSVDEYAIALRERMQSYYCTAIEAIEQPLKDELRESSHFPDLELIETRDPTVYFDTQPATQVPAASPVQAWLELQAGDKRQSEAAKIIRQRILSELQTERRLG